jgi:hypothetical protein
MVGVLAGGLVAASGPSRPRFAWHDPDALRALAAPHGAPRGGDRLLRAGNEDPGAFRVTSPYRVIRLTVPVTA